MTRSNTLFAALAAIVLAAPAARAQSTLQAPASIRSMAGTLSAAGEGRRTFLKLNCYGCHGGNGGGGMAVNIQHAESGDVREAVMQGEERGMPSFRKYVTSADITNLTAYLRSIGGASEPKFWDWWVSVPPK